MSGEKVDFLDQMMGSKAVESEAVSETVTDLEAAGEKQVEAPVTPAVSTEAATPAAKSEHEERVPIAAVMAEREKRQKYEKELAEARKQLEEIQQAKAQQLPEFFTDPEGYVQAVVSQAEFRAKDRTYAMLEEEQREAHEDFDVNFEAALAEAQQNPAVAKEILNAKNPAKAAYQLGKRMAQHAAMSQDPAKYEAEMEAKFRAKWEAEQTAKLEAETKAKQEAAIAAIPPDLASERSSTSRRAPKTNVFQELFPPKP